MKKNVVLALICMGSLLVAASCSSTKNTASVAKTINLTTWNVTSINDTLTFADKPEHAPTLHFNWDEKRVSGKTGCNSYFATFDIPAPGTITFGHAGSTRMFCVESMYIEDAFLQAFGQITNYSIERQTIRFYDVAGNLLIEATKDNQQ